MAKKVAVTTRSVDTKRRISLSGGSLPDALEGLQPDSANAWRHQNIGRLLLFVFHAFEARMLEAYHAAGFTELRQVHLNVLRHIDYPGGTRIVDLAARAGVSKGAMGQIVDECQRLGLVRLAPDATDKRAKIVSFAERGRESMVVTRRSIRRIESEFARMIGGERFEALRDDLITLRAEISALDRGAGGDGR